MRFAFQWRVFCASLSLALTIGSARGDERDEAAAACIAYQANMNALSKFKCRYTYAKAQAATAEKALAGELTNVRKCDYLLVVDGEKKKLQTLTELDMNPPKNLQKVGNGVGWSVDFRPVADLRLNGEELSYYAPWTVATLTEKGEPMHRWDDNPLDIVGWENSLGPVRLFELWRTKQRTDIGSVGKQVVGGRPVLSVVFQSTQWGSSEFQFSQTEGHLPLRRIDHLLSPEGRKYPETQKHLLETRDVGKQRWFPIHSLRLIFPDKEGAPIFVTDVRVTELVMDKVTEEDLTIELPAGTEIGWRLPDKHNDERFKLRQKERLSPKDIPRVQSMLHESATKPLMDTAVKSYERKSNLKWYLLGGGATLVGASLVVYRRARQRPA
jgi:hypothetical protein